MSIEITNIQKKNVPKSNPKKDFSLATNFQFLNTRKISDKKKLNYYKNLSLLLSAGIDFGNALEIIKNQQTKERDASFMRDLHQRIITGKSFSEALEVTGQFSNYEIFSIKIGEDTKTLDIVLNELQKFFERKIKLRKQIISIITYPAFILILTFATLYFMLNYVVPLFESVYNQFDKELPKLTKMVISLSENFNKFLLITLSSFLIIFLIYKRFSKTNYYRELSTKIIVRIPFFGRLVKEIYLTRFCHSMALLLSSKVTLINALSMVRKMIGFYPLESAIEDIEKKIEKGETLGRTMEHHAIFDKNLTSMVSIAEQVNQLESMFKKIAAGYDDEVSHKTKIMGTILEPFLILFIGAIVGVIMISMYAPMFDLSKVIGG